MNRTLQVRARPLNHFREEPCTIRRDVLLKALIDQIEAEVEDLTRKKTDLERRLAVLNVLKEMGL